MAEQAIRCPSCQAEIPPGARSCLSCGFQLPAQPGGAVEFSAAEPESEAPPPLVSSTAEDTLSTVNRALLVLVIVVIIAAVLINVPQIVASLSGVGWVLGGWILLVPPSAVCCHFLAAAKGYHENYALLWGVLGGLLALVTYAGLPDRRSRELLQQIERHLSRQRGL